LGVRFDADRFGRLALGLEGGHSARRVVHAGGSATGRRLLRQLSALAVQEPRIAVLENVRARALWRREDDVAASGGHPSGSGGMSVHGRASVGSGGGPTGGGGGPTGGGGGPTGGAGGPTGGAGGPTGGAGGPTGGAGGPTGGAGGPTGGGGGTSARGRDGAAGVRCGGLVCEDGRTIAARAVVLGTGGAAALWARSTNPPGSQGVGMLLAHALGAKLADLEFVQFHPTAVKGVRGREGFLITEAIRGEGATLHDAGGERFVDELAPRDEVSRAIWARMRETGAESVGLDMRGIDPALFPNVVGSLREAGVDPARELVPVAPAAHYTMGGVVTDLRARSSVRGLYAVGETSCTGLHGANRLASNSLSECFVFGKRAAESALEEPYHGAATGVDPGELRALADRSEIGQQAPPSASAGTREALWREAGIERSADGLGRLAADPHPLARMIAACALEREESRGAHRRVEQPEADPELERRHIVVDADGALAWETWA
jgi:aspartate oxidase